MFYAKQTNQPTNKQKQKPYSNIDFCVSSICRDLHLDDVTDIAMLSDAKFLVKRATDAIMQRDRDAKDTQYEFS